MTQFKVKLFSILILVLEHITETIKIRKIKISIEFKLYCQIYKSFKKLY